MGQHHRRDDVSGDDAVTQAIRLVPHDAPPAGLGYPDPVSYRPHPLTGVPTPPRAAAPVRTRRRASRAATRLPLTVAVAGAAMALVGMGSQLPDLVQAVATTTASAPAAPAPADPAVARQCASVVADALDGAVADLGNAPSSRWDAVLDARGDALAATYGDTSPEHRAFERGADDIVAWLRSDGGEDYTTVTPRVARAVAETCGAM